MVPTSKKGEDGAGANNPPIRGEKPIAGEKSGRSMHGQTAYQHLHGGRSLEWWGKDNARTLHGCEIRRTLATLKNVQALLRTSKAKVAQQSQRPCVQPFQCTLGPHDHNPCTQTPPKLIKVTPTPKKRAHCFSYRDHNNFAPPFITKLSRFVIENLCGIFNFTELCFSDIYNVELKAKLQNLQSRQCTVHSLHASPPSPLGGPGGSTIFSSFLLP